MDQIKGAFYPFVDMAKDLVDTKAYRSWWYVREDILQTIYGIGNVLKGIAYIVGFLPVFLCDFFCICFYALTESNYSFCSGMKCASIKTVSWFFDGINSICWGSTQIAATPLVWVKMAIRGIITFFTDESTLLIENRRSIQTLLSKIIEKYNGNEVDFGLIDKISNILKKRIARGEKSSISLEQEEKTQEAVFASIVVNEADKDRPTPGILAYLKLFNPNIECQRGEQVLFGRSFYPDLIILKPRQ